MNEPLSLASALVSGRVARSDFSSAVFGGRFVRAFRPNGWRFGFSAACCCAWALSWLDFTLSRVVIGSGCCCVSLDLSWPASS